MSRYIRVRLMQAAIVMMMVVGVNFVLLHMVPGDYVDVLAGQANMDASQMQALRERYGLDQPLTVQFVHYISGLARLDFGYSPHLAMPVSEVLAQRLPLTLLLVCMALACSLFIGTFLGVTAARVYGSFADMLISVVTLLFYATPLFLASLMLVLIFSVKLHWLPVAGLVTPGVDSGLFQMTEDIARHLVMPVTSLSLLYIAIYARLSRASMIDSIRQDYVRTAIAKGLPKYRVIYIHALRNALLPLVTMAGLQIGSMLGGAVLVESVFGLTGLGRTAYDAVLQRDANLLLGVLLVASAIVVVVNLAVDLLYAWIDPRVKIK